MSLTDVEQKQGETLTSAVFDALRSAVITGEFAPGEKLRVRQLADRFGTGLSPIREALNRLLHDGLVQQSDLRGFSVAPATEADLEELTKARIWANEKALRESIVHGDAVWEENVLIAYHRLSRIEAQVADTRPDIDPAWDAAHAAFHLELISACGSRWLIGFCTQLFGLADRYRHLSRMSPQAGARRRNEEHRLIMEATIARDADMAADLLSKHFLTTASLSRDALHHAVDHGKPSRSRRGKL